MVDFHEQKVATEIDQRRQHVTAWIQDSLRPVDRLIKYDGLLPDSVTNTDIKTEAQAPEFEVREYQLDAWAAIWDARQAGETHGLGHLATGLGKTSVAVFDALKFREEFRAEHGRDPKIMFTVHQNDILNQAAERFQAFMPDGSIGFYNGNDKNMGSDITFATFQSLHANLNSLDPKTFDYIIDDEVHHAKADTYEKVVKHFKPEFRLGLTATPNRADDKDIREIYGQELYSKGLAEALSEGWLATPDYHIVFDDAVKEAMQSGFEANSLKALKELFDVKPRNDTIADNIREEVKKIGLEFGSVKAIVFCQDIEHAEEMAELLGGKAYHSETDDKDRKNVFDEFKNGDLQVITTRDMFNEGVDVPDARLLVFLRSTSSQTIFEQQLGRGLRKAEGKERVSVLDFVANVERIAMVKDLAEQVKKPRNTGGNTGGEDGQTGEIIDDTLEPIENGFAIHTNHGDFDFDTMVVNLLERYQELSEQGVSKFISFTDEELIGLAKGFSPETALTQIQVNTLSKDGLFASASLVTRRFGSFAKFQEACGFEIRNFTEMSNDELIELAQQLSPDKALTKRVMAQLSKDGVFPSDMYIRKRFGSTNEFNTARGFSVIDRTKKTIDVSLVSDDELIEIAKELSPESPLKVVDIERLSKDGLFPSVDTIRKRFSSIASFQEASGFTAAKADTSAISNEEIIEQAKRLSPDKPMSAAMVRDLSKDKKFVSPALIVKRFGGMKAFQEACGFEGNAAGSQSKFNKYSDEALVALARELNPERPLYTREMAELSKQGIFPSEGLIASRFGGMKAFQEAWNKS